MGFVFASYDKFLTEYKIYHFDKFDMCKGICELVETNVI